jgi:hypothetical protein
VQCGGMWDAEFSVDVVWWSGGMCWWEGKCWGRREREALTMSSSMGPNLPRRSSSLDATMTTTTNVTHTPGIPSSDASRAPSQGHYTRPSSLLCPPPPPTRTHVSRTVDYSSAESDAGPQTPPARESSGRYRDLGGKVTVAYDDDVSEEREQRLSIASPPIGSGLRDVAGRMAVGAGTVARIRRRTRRPSLAAPNHHQTTSRDANPRGNHRLLRDETHVPHPRRCVMVVPWERSMAGRRLLRDRLCVR